MQHSCPQHALPSAHPTAILSYTCTVACVAVVNVILWVGEGLVGLRYSWK
jgi:hypothetical protein